MKYLVTGPMGFVGARIMDELKEAIPAPSFRSADEDVVKRLVDMVQPDVIIHTAAISDIGACAKEPEASYKANVVLPIWLVKTGVKSILFSSDQIYSGCNSEGPYTEEDAAPANLYAQEKLEMEWRALEINPATVLLRATWMYDMPRYGSPNRGNFLVNMLRSAELAFSSSQHRAVTYVREVSAWIAKACQLPGGVYNYGSENELTTLETARWLAEVLKLRITLREGALAHNLWMDCGKIRQHGIHFKTTIEGLKQCIQDYGL